MLAEPFIAFFLLRYGRKILRNSGEGARWDKPILYFSYAIIILFAADILSHENFIFKWIWHFILLAILAVAIFREEFSITRTICYAVLPFALVSFFKDAFESISTEKFKLIDSYLNIAVPFTFVWMIVMIFVSRKQQKALQIERSKTLQEEEQRKLVAARKEELEKIVAERTAELRSQKEQVEQALANLKATQTQLIQSEKMASLGELTAGIAHEIQNPLNFVNNFSEVNTELIAEMKQAIEKGNFEEVNAIAKDIEDNEQKIIFHGKRADSIVKGMLQHSRSSGGVKELTDINALADEYFRLAYHGLRAKDKTFNAVIKTDFDENIGSINICPQDVGRVILNMITNAFYSVTEKKKQLDQMKDNNDYQPTVSVSTRKVKGKVEIKVSDNGEGIKQNIINKIFQPFFTTKPTGKGTGLGLSMSYDIITNGHNGEIKVETKEGEGSTFIIILPL
jgi:two-component system, NtrC family, sensor kinase